MMLSLRQPSIRNALILLLCTIALGIVSGSHVVAEVDEQQQKQQLLRGVKEDHSSLNVVSVPQRELGSNGEDVNERVLSHHVDDEHEHEHIEAKSAKGKGGSTKGKGGSTKEKSAKAKSVKSANGKGKGKGGSAKGKGESILEVPTPAPVEVEVFTPAPVEIVVPTPAPVEVVVPSPTFAPVEVVVPTPAPVEFEVDDPTPAPVEASVPSKVPVPAEVPVLVEIPTVIEVNAPFEVNAPIEINVPIEVDVNVELPPFEVSVNVELPPFEVVLPGVKSDSKSSSKSSSKSDSKSSSKSSKKSDSKSDKSSKSDSKPDKSSKSDSKSDKSSKGNSKSSKSSKSDSKSDKSSKSDSKSSKSSDSNSSKSSDSKSDKSKSDSKSDKSSKSDSKSRKSSKSDSKSRKSSKSDSKSSKSKSRKSSKSKSKSSKSKSRKSSKSDSSKSSKSSDSKSSKGKPILPSNPCADVTCENPIEGCDPFDGTCRSVDLVVPCVAIIDESSQADTFIDSLWNEFRTTYPARPFCLLQPLNPNSSSSLYRPLSFEMDPRTKFAQVSRDNKAENSAIQPVPSDWFTACGFDMLKDTGIGYIGKFLDTSGSMTLNTVAASNDLFNQKLKEAGLEVREVFNDDEDWITPFLTTLVPDPTTPPKVPYASEETSIVNAASAQILNAGRNGLSSSEIDATAVAGLIGVCCVVLLMVGIAVNHRVKRRVQYTRLG